jgi:HK97 family phage major capsid protein
VGNEARTYRPDTDPGGRQFLLDVARRFLGMDVESEYRLAQHMREERVERAAYYQRAAGDAIVSAFSGLVVPQYLTDMVAPAVAGLRPFADICNKHPLPTAGMTFNISKITTATSAALQATELTAVSATSIDDTLLPISVKTAAGQQLMSRQAIERGTGTEDVTVQDLYKRYATVLDSTLINEASTGLTNVAQNVAYTDTTPTAAELWPKIHNALANQEAALLAQATPTHVVMHSRRWYWLQSQVGTSWPFIAQPGIPTQAGGINLGVGYAQGSRGVLPNGMPVVVDNNISTALGAGTEDEIYTVAASECHLWEDAGAPTFIRAEQPSAASLGVLLVLYGYFAYTHNRYTNGQSKISGTGLIAPVF